MDLSPNFFTFLFLLFIGSIGTSPFVTKIRHAYAMDYHLTSYYFSSCSDAAEPSACGSGEGMPVAEPQISWPLHAWLQLQKCLWDRRFHRRQVPWRPTPLLLHKDLLINSCVCVPPARKQKCMHQSASRANEQDKPPRSLQILWEALCLFCVANSYIISASCFS